MVTTVVATVQLSDMTTFDPDAFRAQLAKSMGVDTASVTVSELNFKVEVKYTFSSAVTEEQAKQGVASMAGVLPSAVSVQISAARRLQQQSGTRRLAGVDVQAEITADSPAGAQSLISTASDTAALVDAMARNGVNTAVEVATPPAGKVVVVTALRSSTDNPVAAPTEDQLSQVGSAIGGTVVVTSVDQGFVDQVPEHISSSGTTSSPPSAENAEPETGGVRRLAGGCTVALALWATLEGGSF